MTHNELLRKIYDEALNLSSEAVYSYGKLEDNTKRQVEYIVSISESRKGLLSVLTTVLAHKVLFPEQDIRKQRADIENGYSGRVIDKDHVTPFLKDVSFPAMAEAGWLTRSFEQPHPYTLDYPGKITPKKAKECFLLLIDDVQNNGVNPYDTLLYMFVLLIIQRDAIKVELAKPHSLSISAIIALLEKHFTAKYTGSGASRLPTLALYAVYECMMSEVFRYKDMNLCSLESHTSADKQSGRIGDIDVNYEDGNAFEGVEIKHGIVITRQLVTDAYEKFKIYNTDRYYLLTTADMSNADWSGINEEIARIAGIHGCQVIVNGVYATLRYYLRLLDNPAEFVDKYVDLLKADETIKFQHRTAWNDVVSGN